MNLDNLSDEIHQNALDKGFWKINSNMEEKFALILTELGESIEAHRSNKRAKYNDFRDAIESYEGNYNPAFEGYIKNSVEDELADTVIRCLDYIRKGSKEKIIIHKVNIDWSDNFAANILKIIRDNIEFDTHYIISYVESLCDFMDIDLYWHIREKMKYNANREKLHGKEY